MTPVVVVVVVGMGVGVGGGGQRLVDCTLDMGQGYHRDPGLAEGVILYYWPPIILR